MTSWVGRRGIRSLAALGLVVVLSAPAMRGQARGDGPAQGGGQVMKLKVNPATPHAGQRVYEVTLPIPSGAKASTILELVNDSDKAISDLKFLTHLVPAEGQPALAPTIEVKTEGKDVAGTGLSIEPHKAVLLTLTVSDSGPGAALEGWLVAVRDDVERQFVARVKLERIGPPIKLIDLLTSDTLNHELPVNRLRRRLTFQSVAPAGLDVEIVMTPLVGPNGQTVTPTVTVAGRAEAAKAAEARPAEPGVVRARVIGPGYFYLDLDSDGLTVAGPYTGALEIRPAGAAPITVRLAVTRKRTAAPVEITPLNPVQDSTFPLWRTEIGVRLKETSGQTVTLEHPGVVSLTREAGAAKEQARGDAATVSSPDGHEDESTLTLKPGEVKLVWVPLSPIRRPGKYTGLLRFGAPDYLAIEQSFTVLKQHPWWLAALVILLGIVLSYAQRTYYARTLPRKQQERNAARLSLRLDEARRKLEPLSVDEKNAFSGLEEVLKEIHDQADGTAGIDTRLATASARLELLIQAVPLRVMLESVQPAGDAVPYRDRLTAALAVVADANATPDAIKQKAGDLTKIPQELFVTARSSLQKQLAAFKEEVRKQVEDLDQKPELKKQLEDQVESRLGDSERRLGAASSLNDVQAVRAMVGSTRGAYARILVQDLRRILDSDRAPGFSPDEWLRLHWDLGPALDNAERVAPADPEKAVVLYNRAFARYLYECAGAMGREASRRGEARSKPGADENEDKKKEREAEKGEWDALAKSVEGVRDNLRQQKVDEAVAGYREALKKFHELDGEGAAGGIPSPTERAATASSAVPAATGPVQGADDVRHPVLDPATEIAEIDRWFASTQWAVLWFVLVIGTLTGLQTLWAGNPTWGGWTDLAAAFVWGAGLQQIAGFTSDQVMDAVDQRFR